MRVARNLLELAQRLPRLAANAVIFVIEPSGGGGGIVCEHIRFEIAQRTECSRAHRRRFVIELLRCGAGVSFC